MVIYTNTFYLLLSDDHDTENKVYYCYFRCSITITYETSPESSALQWLKPEQTAGKKLPYLFSQCQVSIEVDVL